MNTVSVVMAVYNGAKFIDEQIGSILTQSRPPMELIVADDGSRDDSLRRAKDWAERDKRVAVHANARNLGIVGNFLKACARAAGDYVCLSDQDDVWAQDKIETLAGLLDADGRNMMAYSDMEVCGADLSPISRSFWRTAGIRPRAGRVGEKALLRNIAPGCTMALRREVVEEVRAHYSSDAFIEGNRPARLDDSPLMHDHLMFILSAGMGRIAYTARPLMKYRQHGANNIGAFYGSVNDRSHFVGCLRKRIDLIRLSERAAAGLDLDRLQRFCSALERGQKPAVADALRYFTFMREDRAPDRAAGVLEALSPAAYSRIKRLLKPGAR